jgi:hypothetical protein
VWGSCEGGMRRLINLTILFLVIAVILVGCHKSSPLADAPAISGAVEAVMIINTSTPKIRLIDENNIEVGSLTFEKEVTVKIKRKE